MTTIEILKSNILSPIVLAFLLGIETKLLRSELSLPKDLYSSLSIYLLLALGLKSGVELSESSVHSIALPAAVTILLGCITPISAYFLLRKLGRFSSIDSAALAAHYGSVSAVTFIAATQFATNLGAKLEGFMPAHMANKAYLGAEILVPSAPARVGEEFKLTGSRASCFAAGLCRSASLGA